MAESSVRRISPEERRRYVRVRKEVRLTCRLIGRPREDVEASMRNIGVGGLHIHALRPLAVGTRLQVQGIITDSGIEFVAGGRVMWCEYDRVKHHYDVGLCFMGLDPIQRRNVLALVARELPTTDGLERRRYIRLKRLLLVERRPAGRLLSRWRPAYTEDLSVGGLALLAGKALAVGAHLELRVHLDDGVAEPLDAEGIVVNVKPSTARPGAWLASARFLELFPEAAERLRRYLSKMLSAPPITAVTAPEERPDVE